MIVAHYVNYRTSFSCNFPVYHKLITAATAKNKKHHVLYAK